jgi:tetratricopeptide (TPR) repeat protein
LGGHIVVSSARSDAGPIVDDLARLLRTELPTYELIRTGLPAGEGTVDVAIRTCRALVLVATPDAVRGGSEAMHKLGLAEMFGRPVVVLRAQRSVRLPAGIPSRNVVDVSGGVPAALPLLRQVLDLQDRPAVLTVDAPPMTAPAVLHARRAEVAELAGCVLSPDVRLVTIVGAAGVGKTALACHLLQQWPKSEPLGVVHLGPPSELPLGYPRLFRGLCRLLPDAAAARLAARHRNPRETPTAMMYAVLEALPPGPVVVLIDGAEHLVADAGGTLDAALAEAVRALMSAPGHAVTVVATSRVPPDGLLARDPAGLRRIDLDELPLPAAAALLQARDPDGALGLRDADPGVLAGAGGNPRALEMLAAVLAGGKDSLAELLAEVQHTDAVDVLPDRTFDRLGLPDETAPTDPVDVLSTRAFGRLDLIERHAAAALAAFPVPVPAVAVDHVLRHFHTGADTADVLDQLHRRGLLLHVDGRYALRAADRERALDGVPVGQPSDVHVDPLPVSRNAMWHLAADLLATISTPFERWASLDDLAPQLAEFELHWANDAIDEAALLLMRGAVAELRGWGHHRLIVSLLDRLRERINEPWLNAWCVSALGTAFAGMGQPNRAIELHERAGTIYNRIGDRIGEAETLGHLGHCHADLGDLPRALRLHERALALHTGTGDRLAEAACRVDVAWCFTELGRPDDAVPLLHAALRVQDDLGDTWAQIDTLATLGRTLACAGHLEQAGALLERGIGLSRQEGDRWSEARTTRLLGACRRDAGRIPEALALHQRTLDLSREVGDREDEAVALADLAVGHLLLGTPTEALPLAERAFTIAAEIGDLRMRAACLEVLGDCHLALDRPGDAAGLYREAIAVADPTGYLQVQVRARIRLARLHLAVGDLGTAGQLARAAARHPHPPTQAETTLLTGAVRLRSSDVLTAQQYFRTAIAQADERLRRSPGTPEYAVLDVRALAHAALAVAGERGQATEAVGDFRAARALAAVDGVVGGVLRWLDTLAAGADLDRLRSVAAGRETVPVAD